MLAKLNALLTRAGTRVVQKTAQLLLASERYDEFFFETLRSNAPSVSHSGNVVHLGQHYAVVRKNVVETADTVNIMEVMR